MALLDMTDVLCDPDLASMFDVIRREETVGDDGIGRVVPVEIPGQVGVICHASTGDLLRRDDSSMMNRKISIVTTYPLRGPGATFKADQVRLECVVYTVVEILPYRRFGPGFTEAVCSSMNAADPAAQ